MTKLKYFFLSLVVFSTIQGLDSKRLLELSDIMGSSFSPKTYNGGWLSDTQMIYIQDGVITIFDATTQKATPLGDGSYMKNNSASNYFYTDDVEWIALSTDCEEIYRYSNLCNYTLIEIKTGNTFIPAGGKKLQLLRWIPKSHSLVYVLENDVYYQECPKTDAAKRISTNGKPGVVYNGVGDWVYEEEVLSKTRAMIFALGGTKFAYISYDDSNVLLEHYPEYGTPGSVDSQYVKDETVKFPKVATALPIATVHVIDVKTAQEIKVPGLCAPEEDVTSDHILAGVTFADDNNIVASWANRSQNILVSTMCDLTTLKCHKILETKQTNGWVGFQKFFFKNPSTFATILPQAQGSDGTYQHLTVVSTGMVQKPLTTGKRHVSWIIGYDTVKSMIYYVATDGTTPLKLNVYVISDDGSVPEKCLSCGLCGSAEGLTSLNFTYYMLACAGPAPYFFSVYTTKENKFIMEVKNNTKVAYKLQEVILPEISTFELDLTDGFKAMVRVLCPPGMDKNGKYPLILNVDGPPGWNSVTDSYYTPDFNYYMATSMQIVVALADVRGAGRRGDNYRFATYKKIGQDEIKDIISVAELLIAKYSFIDTSRVGIWGEENAAYMAAMTLAKDKNKIFKYGISVSPLIRYEYYDAIYSERLMGLLDDNTDGYNQSDVTQFTQGFKDKQFLLIAGTKNENFQYQHAAILARSLQMNNIPFEMQSYIDEAFPLRGFSDDNVQLHYYNTMVEFWTRNFNLTLTNYTMWTLASN
ncbi:hypothetical protein LSTR_LSTR006396 [Laodelphax striatellus]|uniref:Peptidase S9 prolyl oligopeptidase catalytic domain-containing protein n=1 Tax=Laodelphax striatellus TaxID=195883 RepID=A0A482WWN3_LAOST|nr:hypothetical protein LSTR_LSTR006396 [Laodelphax striatellus]